MIEGTAQTDSDPILDALQHVVQEASIETGAEHALARAAERLRGVHAARVQVNTGEGGEPIVLANARSSVEWEAARELRIPLPRLEDGIDYDLAILPDVHSDSTAVRESLELFTTLVAGHLHGFAARREAAAARANLDRANRRLEAATKRLLKEQRVTLLGRLIANMAHELNNPMMGIQGSAQALQAIVGDSISRELVDAILSECRRCSDILSCVMELGDEGETPHEITDPAKILVESVQWLEYRFRQREVRTAVNIPDQMPCLDGDPRVLKQVLLNLLEALLRDLEHAPTPRHLEARASVEANDIVIELTTSTLSRATTGERTGTATRLALWVLTAAVDNMGGHASIRRHPEEPAEIRMNLPVSSLVERLEKDLHPLGSPPSIDFADAGAATSSTSRPGSVPEGAHGKRSIDRRDGRAPA